MSIIGNEWDKILEDEYNKNYFLLLQQKLQEEYENEIIYPPKDKVYSAMRFVDYNDVKVVILGQDPYHGEGQANGMAFAVNKGIPLPPSLINIYKEIEEDLHIKMPSSGTLIGWAKQGILLLNTVLTVRKGQAFSHSQIGWQIFTDVVIQKLSFRKDPMVFLLWGSGAIGKSKLISKHHLVLTSPHPSPLSAYRGFFGSRPFSKTNDFLLSQNKKAIDWADVDGFERAYYYNTSKNIYKI